MKELYNKIEEQLFRMNKAIANGFMVNQEKERMQNVLFNNAQEICDALKQATEMEEKIAVLELELNDAEAELAELDQKLGKGKKQQKDATA